MKTVAIWKTPVHGIIIIAVHVLVTRVTTQELAEPMQQLARHVILTNIKIQPVLLCVWLVQTLIHNQMTQKHSANVMIHQWVSI